MSDLKSESDLKAESEAVSVAKPESHSLLPGFRTYQLAVRFHHECGALGIPPYLRDQLERATSSVVLNLAEGSAKPTAKDQARFYFIALGSLREASAVLDLAKRKAPELVDLSDHLGASLYKLCEKAKAGGGVR